MNKMRRKILSGVGATGAAALTSTLGLLGPSEALALTWNKEAFAAKSSSDSLKTLGYGNAIESNDISIKAPEIAENGAVVPIEVTSKIPGTQSIAVLVDKNPSPLVGEFNISAGLAPYISTRIKMGQSSAVRVFVKAGGQTYTATRLVRVTIGGCGG